MWKKCSYAIFLLKQVFRGFPTSHAIPWVRRLDAEEGDWGRLGESIPRHVTATSGMAGIVTPDAASTESRANIFDSRPMRLPGNESRARKMSCLDRRAPGVFGFVRTFRHVRMSGQVQNTQARVCPDRTFSLDGWRHLRLGRSGRIRLARRRRFLDRSPALGDGSVRTGKS
jgi:hypothetical protein